MNKSDSHITISVSEFNRLLAIEKEVLYLREEVKQLKEELTVLVSRQNKNSGNSHKPPSSDIFSKRAIKNNRQATDNLPGGQPGHKGTTLEMSAIPDHVITVDVEEGSCTCGRPLSEAAHKGYKPQQVIELVPRLTQVTEYRAQVKVCACGKSHQAQTAYTSPVQYGPKIQALSVYLSNQQYIPFNRVQELFSDIFGFTPSDGFLQKANLFCYNNLGPVMEQIRQQLKASAVNHNDETSVQITEGPGDKPNWVHVASNNHFTFYAVHPKRGREAIDEIGILPGYQGVSVHDRLASYNKYDCSHALCNAHLLRDLKFVSEELKKEWATDMATVLLDAKKLKEQDRLSEENLIALNKRYDRIVETALGKEPEFEAQATIKPGKKKKAVSRRLLEDFKNRKEQILLFMYRKEVPFDNNLAERDLRMIKLKQKISGCFRSKNGAEIFCRIRSYISTVRKQKLNIFDALTKAISNKPICFLGSG